VILPFIGVYSKNLRTAAKGVSKGFYRNPLFFGGALAVFFFGVSIFCSQSIIKSFVSGDSSFFAAALGSKAPQSLFIESAKNFLRNSPEVNYVQENSLMQFSPPASVSSQTLGAFFEASEIGSTDRRGITEYSVGQGDTISSIANKFDVSVDTILWANNLAKSSPLKVGQTLIIPPVSGVLYHVKKGDTLSAIAKTYKANTDDMVAFNELSGEGDIYVGDILVIPDGKMPVISKPVQYAQIPIASSYFICPTATCKRSQGLHWYNAVDVASQCGDPIHAAAAGTVQKVRYGWNNGGGNYLTIMHPNGVVTYYGHLATSLVSAGQTVSQGQIIAYIGGQPGTAGAGKSTGCHVHFGVYGATNPLAR